MAQLPSLVLYRLKEKLKKLIDTKVWRGRIMLDKAKKGKNEAKAWKLFL